MKGTALDIGSGTPTQEAYGMHDELEAEASGLGEKNVPNHPACDFSNLNKRTKGNVDDGHGGGDGPGSENSFGGSQYSGNYGGGY